MIQHQQHRMIHPTITTVTAFRTTTIMQYRNVLYHHHQKPQQQQQRYYYRPIDHSLHSHYLHCVAGRNVMLQQQQQQQRRRSYHTSFLRMMPEGPEIRTVVDQLQECIGQRLVSIQFVSGRYYNKNNNDSNIGDGKRIGNMNSSSRTYPDGYLTFQSTLTPYNTHNDDDDDDDDDTVSSLSSLQAVSTVATTSNSSNTDRGGDHVDIITDCNCKGKFMYLLLDHGSISGGSSSSSSSTTTTTTTMTSTTTTTTTMTPHIGNDTTNYQRSIWITFGMTGRFLSERVVRQYQLEEKECHIRWYMELLSLSNNNSQQSTGTQRITRIYYSDMRGFGTLKFSTSRLQLYEKLQSLGPDMLQTCTEQEFISIMQKQKPDLNICRFLMDQSKICGIGNYILAEGLYRAAVDPFATLSEIINHQTTTSSSNLPQQLYLALHSVIHESYESQKDGNDTNQEYEFQCYGQTTCKRYGHPVRKEVNGPHGRTIWYTDQQLFMSRQDRRNKTLPGASKAVSTTKENIDLPISTFSTGSSSSKQQLKKTIQLLSNDLQEKMSRKRSQIDMVITEEMHGTNSEKVTSSTVVSKSPTSVATAITPGNLKLAAILANNSNTKKKKSTTNTNGMEIDGTMTPARNVDTTKLVTKLLSGITEPGWKNALYDTLRSSDTLTKLALFLYEEEMEGKTIYPPRNEIFTALNLCPIDTVKVVIIGQDPYHRYGQGHGLAFSVRKGIRPPPSLQNIFKELIEDIGLDGENIFHGNLSGWAKRGVLLLNTVLTVREGEAFSHANKGWEEVTNTILRVVCDRNALSTPPASEDIPSPRGIVFLLWGNAAIQTIGNIIPSPHGLSNSNIHIITTSHPSPLGATKTKSPFLGSKCFSRANKALIGMGYDPIDWSVE